MVSHEKLPSRKISPHEISSIPVTSTELQLEMRMSSALWKESLPKVIPVPMKLLHERYSGILPFEKCRCPKISRCFLRLAEYSVKDRAASPLLPARSGAAAERGPLRIKPCLYPIVHKNKSRSHLTAAFYVGVFLSSRAVTSQVLSAPASLTSVFGMGTGGPSPSSTPTISDVHTTPEVVHHQGLEPWTP